MTSLRRQLALGWQQLVGDSGEQHANQPCSHYDSWGRVELACTAIHAQWLKSTTAGCHLARPCLATRGRAVKERASE